MPFDGNTEFVFKLRQQALIEALRAEMPEDFTWDFSRYFLSPVERRGKPCGYAGCAIGLMSIIFDDFNYKPPQNSSNKMPYTKAAEYLGLSLKQSENLFSTYSYWDATPQMVADKLASLVKEN